MKRYLYGASVQGIQNFIFCTNNLKDIIGASELVEQICTKLFVEEALRQTFTNDFIDNDDNCITAAAGNVRYILDEDQCKQVVLHFPKIVMEFAPGITISQAVVEIGDGVNQDHFDRLEKKLKALRNKLQITTQHALMAFERNRQVGAAAVRKINGEYIDKASYAKRTESVNANSTLAQKLFDKSLQVSAKDIQYQTDKLVPDESEKSYIAVIHADGNNLGHIIQNLSKRLGDNPGEKKLIKARKNFSKAIEAATQKAVQEAFSAVYAEDVIISNEVPMRPVVIGGDDVTVICEASRALEFTQRFLEYFEEQTAHFFKEYLQGFDLGINKLTACAGIAFIKSKFPFHYAVRLAEELCSEAKKASKQEGVIHANGYVPASLAFYKVESSFFNTYPELKVKVLQASGVDLSYGPYAIHPNTPVLASLDTFLRKVSIVKEPKAPASAMRRWLSALHHNREEAQQLMDRTIEVLKIRGQDHFIKELELEHTIMENKSPIHDIVALSSIIKTNNSQQ